MSVSQQMSRSVLFYNSPYQYGYAFGIRLLESLSPLLRERKGELVCGSHIDR